MARVLIAKLGLDGHDRGAKTVALYLRDKGHEVIYSGIRRTPKDIAVIALQEDVDVIGISILSGAHRILIESLFGEMARNGIDVPVIVGGIIPGHDVKYLKSLGVRKVFHNSATFGEIEEYLRSRADAEKD